MSNQKPFTSSIPEIAAKQRERGKAIIREQLPLIIECLMEDDVLLGQLAAALKSAEPTAETKTKK